MRETVSVSLPPELKEELDRLSKEEGVSRSDLIRASLREYIFEKRFRVFCANRSLRTHAHGALSDQDLLDRLS